MGEMGDEWSDRQIHSIGGDQNQKQITNKHRRKSGVVWCVLLFCIFGPLKAWFWSVQTPKSRNLRVFSDLLIRSLWSFKKISHSRVFTKTRKYPQTSSGHHTPRGHVEIESESIRFPVAKWLQSQKVIGGTGTGSPEGRGPITRVMMTTDRKRRNLDKWVSALFQRVSQNKRKNVCARGHIERKTIKNCSRTYFKAECLGVQINFTRCPRP